MAHQNVFITSVKNTNSNNTESEFGYLDRILRTHSTDFRSTWYYGVKRLMDVVVAFTALVLLAPLMLLIAIAIKLTSPGPVIFKQERVGSRRRVMGDQARWETYAFTFYKFRSMRKDADTGLHQAFMEAFIDGDTTRMAALNNNQQNACKLIHDLRITRIGKYLRNTSLDELPQLWNILKGDMSLVGPRPALAYEMAKYRAWHHLRFNAVPGLTGLWQVEGRGAVGFEQMMQLDLLYIQKQSLWTDVKIVLKTPFAVMRGTGHVSGEKQ